MASREYARSEVILDDSSVTGDVYSGIIHPGKNNGFALTYDWDSSGNMVGSLYLQCRNHPDESWATVNNASFPSSPDGSAGNDEYSVCDAFHNEYRVFCDFTSGDGELVIRVRYGS